VTKLASIDTSSYAQLGDKLKQVQIELDRNGFISEEPLIVRPYFQAFATTANQNWAGASNE